MNYDQARPLENGRGWHWTTMNDGRIRTAWPCLEYTGPELTQQTMMRPTAPDHWKRCEPHATKEEAERHFYDACLAAVEEINHNWQGCRVCDRPTKKSLGNRYLGHHFSGPTPLCDEHRTREELQQLRPFEPGIAFAHS